MTDGKINRIRSAVRVFLETVLPPLFMWLTVGIILWALMHGPAK